MEAAAATAAAASTKPPAQFEPNIEAIKRRLIKKGVYPTPKIIHILRKKEIQKHNRKLNKIASQTQQQQQTPLLTPSQKQALAEESHFQTLKREYRAFNKAIEAKTTRPLKTITATSGGLLVGKPWERIERVKLREIASGSSKEFYGGSSPSSLKRENLRELKKLFEDDLRWVLENDVEIEDDALLRDDKHNLWNPPPNRRRNEREAIRFLVARLSGRDVTARDWKLARIMKQSGLLFTEGQLLRIVEGLGDRGKWEQALAVVEWAYGNKRRSDYKSKFVYTKLLSILGKERKPQEALRIFYLMHEDWDIYPDMAAYHSIGVTLGQAGLLKELMKVIECMRQKPPRRITTMRYKNWDPVLEPDVVIYNSVLNGCIPTKQWKGVSWVFKQLRRSGLKPNAATYGLAMEVMLHSGKYDLVYKLFGKMNKSGAALKALTYKVLVRAYWAEGRVNEAVEAVRDMEYRGIIGTASVYYELACCLCHNGRWQDAILEVERIKNLRHSKPLEVTFTGMILSSMEGGHVDDCTSIFEHMKSCCFPNIGTINVMLKVYSKNDLFSKAKELFEEIKGANDGGSFLTPDVYTYSSMLEASASALQWEYFEYVYREMVFHGYRLDQSKHASLLVNASRAGKGHLLEHAFDAILEAEEIPNPLFFTEMILQATAQQDYGRAVTLVNALAYAPFQVSERQWMVLFQGNGNRMGRDNLERLLDALSECEAASEVTVSNLSRTLHSLCRPGTSILSCSIAADIDNEDDLSRNVDNGESTACESEDRSSISATSEDENPELFEHPFDHGSDTPHDLLTVDHSVTNGVSVVDTDVVSTSENCRSNADESANLSSIADFLANDVASGASMGCFGWEEDNEMEMGVPKNKDGPHAPELPSAFEILHSWKEEKKKMGLSHPLKFGQK